MIVALNVVHYVVVQLKMKGCLHNIWIMIEANHVNKSMNLWILKGFIVAILDVMASSQLKVN